MPVPGRVLTTLSRAVGLALRDTLLTLDEYHAMAGGLADSDDPATGTIMLTDWIAEHPPTWVAATPTNSPATSDPPHPQRGTMSPHPDHQPRQQTNTRHPQFRLTVNCACCDRKLIRDRRPPADARHSLETARQP
jgi:hypothetical protein